ETGSDQQAQQEGTEQGNTRRTGRQRIPRFQRVVAEPSSCNRNTRSPSPPWRTSGPRQTTTTPRSDGTSSWITVGSQHRARLPTPGWCPRKNRDGWNAEPLIAGQRTCPVGAL